MRAWYTPIRTRHSSSGSAIDPWEQMRCGPVPAPAPLPEYQRKNSLTPSPDVMQSQRLRDNNFRKRLHEEGLGQQSLSPTRTKGSTAIVSTNVQSSVAASQQMWLIKLRSEPCESGPVIAGADPTR